MRTCILARWSHACITIAIPTYIMNVWVLSPVVLNCIIVWVSIVTKIKSYNYVAINKRLKLTSLLLKHIYCQSTHDDIIVLCNRLMLCNRPLSYVAIAIVDWVSYQATAYLDHLSNYVYVL